MTANAEKPFFYANSLVLGYSPFDFTLVCQRRGINPGATRPPGETSEADVLAELDVVMSPVQAKILAAMLTNTVNDFERVNGPIKLPPGVTIGGVAAPSPTARN